MTSLVVRAEHVWQRRHTPEAKQLIRYTMVSVISTVVSFGVLALVFGVFHLWGEIESTVFANVVATVPSYFLNRMWVWGKGGRSHLMKEIVPFWVMSAIGIVVSIGGAAVARHIGKTHHLTHLQQTAVVLLANLISFGLFWVLKYMLYNRLFHVHPVEELDELVESGLSSDADAGPASARSGPRRQSRKLLNCSGMPKSSAFRAAMAAWRSSRFFPLTRS